jgi:predicted Ser/Thr protein kinase
MGENEFLYAKNVANAPQLMNQVAALIPSLASCNNRAWSSRTIGVGMCGRVYKVKLDAEFFSVKVVIRGSDKILALKREFQVLDYLQQHDYPHAPKVVGLVCNAVACLLVTEFIRGRSVAPQKFFQLSETTKQKVLNAVRALHELSVKHSDLHEGNVLIEEGTRRVVLIDFGIENSEESIDEEFDDLVSEMLRRDYLVRRFQENYDYY